MRSRDVKACPNFQFIERKLKVLDPAKSLQMDIYFILYCVYMFSLLNIDIYIYVIYIRIKSTLFKYCSNVKQFFFTFFKHKKFSYFSIPFMLKALSPQLIKVKKGANFILFEECNL